MKHRETRSGHVPPQPSAAAAFHARRQRGPQWKVYRCMAPERCCWLSAQRRCNGCKKHKWRMSEQRSSNAQLYSYQWTAPSRSGSSSGDCVLGDAILAEPSCARAVIFVPQGHGKKKLIIPHMLEDKLRQKMGCGVFRTVHIGHDGAGRAEWMTASYEGRIGAVPQCTSKRLTQWMLLLWSKRSLLHATK